MGLGQSRLEVDGLPRRVPRHLVEVRGGLGGTLCQKEVALGYSKLRRGEKGVGLDGGLKVLHAFLEVFLAAAIQEIATL